MTAQLNVGRKAKATATAAAVSADMLTAFRDAFASYHADDGFSLAHIGDKALSDWLIANDGAALGPDDGDKVTDLCEQAADDFDQPEPDRAGDDDETTDDVAPVSVEVTNKRHLKALALAKAFPADFLAEVDAQGQRAIETKRSVAIACRALIAGLKGQDWSEFPRPGTREVDPVTKQRTGINNPDYIAVGETSKKTGKPTTKVVSFWNDAADSTAAGQKFLAELEKAGNIADDSDKRKAVEVWQTRLNNLRRMVRDAARLKFQMDAMNDLPGFTVGFEMDQDAKGNEVFTLSVVNIRVKYVDPRNANIDKRKALTTGEFLRFDVQLLKDRGPNWANFEEGLKRSSPDNDESKDGAFGIPKNAADFASAIISLHNYVEQAKRKSNDWNSLIRSLRRDGQDETLSSMLGVKEWLDDLMKVPAIRDRAEAADVKIQAAG